MSLRSQSLARSPRMARVVFPPLPPQCQTSVFEASKGVQLRGTIVFLHGWPDTVQMWEPTQERFARLGYRCAAVGLPGYGTGVKKKTGFKFTEVDDILEKAVAHVAQGEISAEASTELSPEHSGLLELLCPFLNFPVDAS